MSYGGGLSIYVEVPKELRCYLDDLNTKRYLIDLIASGLTSSIKELIVKYADNMRKGHYRISMANNQSLEVQNCSGHTSKKWKHILKFEFSAACECDFEREEEWFIDSDQLVYVREHHRFGNSWTDQYIENLINWSAISGKKYSFIAGGYKFSCHPSKNMDWNGFKDVLAIFKDDEFYVEEHSYVDYVKEETNFKMQLLAMHNYSEERAYEKDRSSIKAYLDRLVKL